jgi:hypothetical protein
LITILRASQRVGRPASGIFSFVSATLNKEYNILEISEFPNLSFCSGTEGDRPHSHWRFLRHTRHILCLFKWCVFTKHTTSGRPIDSFVSARGIISQNSSLSQPPQEFILMQMMKWVDIGMVAVTWSTQVKAPTISNCFSLVAFDVEVDLDPVDEVGEEEVGRSM